MSTPHNQAQPGDIAPIVLMPGDPLRAQFIAQQYLEQPICFNTVRNMLGYTGTWHGKRISVMGHGMGVPSVTLYAHELYQFYGVDAILRIGSAGGLSDDTKLRDIILASAASTNSHFADGYGFPGQLTPSASWPLLKAAADAAEQLHIPVKVGQVFTADQFYTEDNSGAEQYRKFGILGLEMETAGLYWVAQRLGKQALSLLTISDHIFTGASLPAEERQTSFRQMMELALQTAAQVTV